MEANGVNGFNRHSLKILLRTILLQNILYPKIATQLKKSISQPASRKEPFVPLCAAVLLRPASISTCPVHAGQGVLLLKR